MHHSTLLNISPNPIQHTLLALSYPPTQRYLLSHSSKQVFDHNLILDFSTVCDLGIISMTIKFILGTYPKVIMNSCYYKKCNHVELAQGGSEH